MLQYWIAFIKIGWRIQKFYSIKIIMLLWKLLDNCHVLQMCLASRCRHFIPAAEIHNMFLEWNFSKTLGSNNFPNWTPDTLYKITQIMISCYTFLCHPHRSIDNYFHHNLCDLWKFEVRNLKRQYRPLALARLSSIVHAPR